MKSKLNVDDKKCAPSKIYNNGSCFDEHSLKQIANNYNNINEKKIDVSLSKQELVKNLEEKLSNKCSDQVCWLRLDFVKKIDNDDLYENTFRPVGPANKYDWLSTTHINDVIKQYHYVHNEFLFLGAVPYDFDDLHVLGISNLNFNELEMNKKTKIGIVFNLDEHYKNGSHWVSLFADLNKNQIYYFDSVGKKPKKRIKKFVNRIFKYLYNKKYNKKLHINNLINALNNGSTKENSEPILKNIHDGNFDIRYNHIQHQFKGSECGVYSINFIVRLVGGETFDDVINNITKDDAMNENRKIYFINKS
jgi:hypothetical protein